MTKIVVLRKGRERDQAEIALARLLGQRCFDVEERLTIRTLSLIACSKEPGEDIIGLFASCAVWTCWCDGDRWLIGDPTARDVKPFLPAKYLSGEKIKAIRTLWAD